MRYVGVLVLVLCGCAMQGSDELEAHVPIELIYSNGFAHRRSDGLPRTSLSSSQFYVEFRRAGDGVRLSIKLVSFAQSQGKTLFTPRRVTEPLTGEQELLHLYQSMDNLQAQLPSGVPLGTDQRWRETEILLQVTSKGEHELVIVQTVEPGESDEKGFLRIRPRARTQDKRLVELVSRHCLARWVAHRLGPSSTRQLGGGAVLSAANSLRRFDHVDLSGWAGIRGWQCAIDENLGTATLRKGGRTVLVPLGSSKIKDRSDWVDVGDVIAERDGRWLVPFPALESVNQG